MIQPLCANLNNYTVLIRTPEKSYVHVKAGAAVAGPGFDIYVENRTLTHVAPDYAGAVVYQTPDTYRPEVIIKEEPVKTAEVIEKESNEASYTAVLAALNEGETVAVVEPTPEPPKKNLELKYGGRHLTIPGGYGIRKMGKEELVFVLGKMGLNVEGTRPQLVSRLSPLAGKTVEIRVK